jgi:hypothetical protein
VEAVFLSETSVDYTALYWICGVLSHVKCTIFFIGKQKLRYVAWNLKGKHFHDIHPSSN